MQKPRSQLERVADLMRDGQWRTLPRIRKELGDKDMETALAARLRDFRKVAHGAHRMDCNRIKPGSNLYIYRVLFREVGNG